MSLGGLAMDVCVLLINSVVLLIRYDMRFYLFSCLFDFIVVGLLLPVFQLCYAVCFRCLVIWCSLDLLLRFRLVCLCCR